MIAVFISLASILMSGTAGLESGRTVVADPAKPVPPQQRITYGGFVKLVRGEEEIPLEYIRKFMWMYDRSLLADGSRFLGKFVHIAGRYELIHLRLGNGAFSNEVYVTFNRQTKKQVDVVVFPYVSRTPGRMVALAYIKGDDFKQIGVEYFRMPATRQMVDPSGEKKRAKETWHIDTEGRFCLYDPAKETMQKKKPAIP